MIVLLLIVVALASMLVLTRYEGPSVSRVPVRIVRRRTTRR